MGFRHSGARLRSERLYFTCSRSVQDCFCSRVYGHPSREHLWRSLRCGTPSRNLEIRGLISCWEPSVSLWRCSDLVLGRSMLTFLDGNASTLPIEGVRSHTSFELVLTYPKRVALPFRYGVHGDSIWGCPHTGLVPQSTKNKEACTVPSVGGNSWLPSLYSSRISGGPKKDSRTTTSLRAKERVKPRCSRRLLELLLVCEAYSLVYQRSPRRTQPSWSLEKRELARSLLHAPYIEDQIVLRERSLASTVPQSPVILSLLSCSAMKRAPLRARLSSAWAGLSWQMEARFSSTK